MELNPIEAYVFGCAVLFHDLGMALILWEEQLSILKESKEYKDIAYALLSNKFGKDPSEQDMASLPHDVENIVIATRLRELHAFKAKELPLKSWQFQSQTLYLIENSELRQKLGEKIGIIAASHWWNIEDIRGYFKQPYSPSPTSFPPEWKINNIKIACLLRLADFIHIDDRRAPTFQYSFAKPQDESYYHWLFQNKLNRAHCDGERLVFESKSPFLYTESKAWWLAYNTIVDIDKELKAVDNLLIDTNIDRFQCKGVKGIESEKLFSEYVRTENWEPANTNFKIGNFTNLIKKFGGKELYGENYEVPLRELIQNSSDAILAKHHLVDAFDGDIVVKYYEDDKTGVWLEVEDNGIGMSKSALLYGLLDFGNSYWKSSLVRQEHPGLQSSGFVPTGNFGIGFFSVFMIAEFVQVITKTITDDSKTLVLEFANGLNSNPILREANQKERKFESGTTIKLKINIEHLLWKMYTRYNRAAKSQLQDPLAYCLRRIAPALSVNLYSVYKNNGRKSILKGNDWEEIDSMSLLKRLVGYEPNVVGLELESIESISGYIKPIYDKKTGTLLARATVVTSKRRVVPSTIVVGGLNQGYLSYFPGLWIGKNEVASRSYAKPICKLEDMHDWLHEQYNIVISNKDLISDQLYDIAKIIYPLGVQCKELPIAMTSEGWKSYTDITKTIHNEFVFLRYVAENQDITLSSGNKYYNKILPNVLVIESLVQSVYISNNSSIPVWKDELDSLDAKSGFDSFYRNRSFVKFVIQAISECWGVSEQDIIKASQLDQLKGLLTDVYEDQYGQLSKLNVAVVVNPSKTSLEEVYRKYK